MIREFLILVPRYFNDHRPVPKRLRQGIERLMCERFGGFRVERSFAGGWMSAHGIVLSERNDAYVIATDDCSAIRSLVGILAVLLDQEAMYLRHPDQIVEIVATVTSDSGSVSDDDALSLPAMRAAVTAFVKEACKHATDLRRLERWLAPRSQLTSVLAVALSEQLERRRLGSRPLAVAKVTVDTLRECVDDLYLNAVRTVVERPNTLLHKPLDSAPSPSDPIRLWVAPRLKFFAGKTVDEVAQHLKLSEDTVDRVLDQAGKELLGYWLARYAPNLR